MITACVTRSKRYKRTEGCEKNQQLLISSFSIKPTMRVLLLLASCVVLTSATSLHFRSKLNNRWEMFKQAFKKEYPSIEHETLRRLVFERNLAFIESHNFKADLGLFRFRLGMNEFGDLTNAEFAKQMLGHRHNASRKRDGATFLAPSFVQLPSTVDWRKKGYVTPVKNQGQCGSCWAFSATGSLEGQHFKKTHKLVSLSEQNLVDCSQNYGNMGCDGGLMDYAFEYIKANKGIDTEASYPYRAQDERCRFNKRNVGASVRGYRDIESGSESALQTATATVGPISVGIDASNPSFQFYSSGIYDEPDCSSEQLDHGVLVVGYGSQGEEDYWLVKNSWGESWGARGYIKMSRNKDNQCGIATEASYPLV